MFEKLVESGTIQESGGTRRALVALSSLSVFLLFAGGILTSLFSNALAMVEDVGGIERLATPLFARPEPEPQKSVPLVREAKKTPSAAIPTRKQYVQRTEDVPVRPPQAVSSIPTTLKSRPLGTFVLSDRDFDPPGSGLSSRKEGAGGGFTDTNTDSSEAENKVEVKKPDVPKPPVLKKENPTTSYVGVVNGKAVFLDLPAYPDAARQMGIKGQVKVQVLIDEDGNVLSANAVEGNGLLRSPATKAAKRSKFTPTFLNNQKIKVRGIIVYNFK